YVPGRIFCERCLARLEEWVKVGSSGVLEPWTVLHQGLDGKGLEKPITVGMVRLDGASTVIIHLLDNLDGKALKIGMRVKAVLKPKNKRTGAITDILYFQPE
ncbi:MAG: Zn-ribbon domain-containing OB-fold protein, partial [candidate division WOR-3 bacterium]